MMRCWHTPMPCIRMYNIPFENRNFAAENVFAGVVPSKAFAMLVNLQAYNGDYHLSPYNFVNYGVNKIAFSVDNVARPALNFLITKIVAT